MDISDALVSLVRAMLKFPMFMCYLIPARNIILLRVSTALLHAVASYDISGFSISERLTDTIGVTKLN
jgi:hypothetical protein